jgi:transposase
MVILVFNKHMIYIQNYRLTFFNSTFFKSFMLYFLENSPKIHQKIKVLQNGCINSTPRDPTCSVEKPR